MAMEPMNVEGRALRLEALSLLEWTMEDLSPPGNPLTVKCGIEREGHFIPETLPEMVKDGKLFTSLKWREARNEQRESLAQKLFAETNAATKAAKYLQKIYPDVSGTFLIELVTEAISPTQAALATEELSDAMVEIATKELGIKYACFGTLDYDLMAPLVEKYRAAYESVKKPLINYNEELDGFFKKVCGEAYKNEVFLRQDIAGHKKRVSVGRGQHGNSSVWLGDTNLFIKNGSEKNDTLINHAAAEGLRMLPGVILPCRKDNYERIVRGCQHSITDIRIGDKLDRSAIRIAAEKDEENKVIPAKTRLEFRHGVPEAEPLDIALAATAPLVKACLDQIKLGADGKICVDKQGKPELKTKAEIPRARSAMPTNMDRAITLFNRADNPMYIFLDALAERKIQALQKQYEGNASKENAEALANAQKLKHLGTRLHAATAREFGIESNMQKALAQVPKEELMPLYVASREKAVTPSAVR